MKLLISRVILSVLVTLGLELFNAQAEFPEHDFCPEECDCHYFRVNYVTDCSESNFTEIPYDEISPDVYILDFNACPPLNLSLLTPMTSIEKYFITINLYKGNAISTLKPFPEDIKVRRLQLAENRLTAVDAEMFSGLKVLLDIDLSSNLIQTIDPYAFRDSPGLITVELQNNPLRHISSGPLLICKSLLYLDVSGCGLTNLNDDFFSEVPFLTTLYLSDNPLKNITHRLFTNIVTLEEIRLRNCSLTNLPPDSFENLIHLKVLDLSHNILVNIDWVSIFTGLNRLEHLNLEASSIRNLPDDCFSNNTWLRFLDLSDNPLSDLDLGTTLGSNLKNLHHLDLSNCSLSSLDGTSFQSAEKLRILQLSNNILLPKELRTAFVPLKTLSTLTLRNCSLSKLPKNIFENLTELRELDISWNPLNNVFVELLQPLQNLEILNMGFSNLNRLSRDTFMKTTSIRKLVLSGNKLGDLEMGLLKNLTKLESLELNNCGLKNALDDDVFLNVTYSELRELFMSGNPLGLNVNSGPFIPEQLSKLKTLDLSNCSIHKITVDSFATVANLTKLYIHNNFLTSNILEESLPFKNLPYLEYLDLSSNNFTKLSIEIINGTNLNEIKLTQNPWACNCDLADWWNWAKNKGDISHLIGATLTQEDISKGGSKRKRPLLCSFDGNTFGLRKNVTTKRYRLESGLKTWARYLKESTCTLVPLNVTTTEKSPVYFPEPILPSPKLDEVRMEQQTFKTVSSGGSLVVSLVASGFVVVVMVVGLGIFVQRKFIHVIRDDKEMINL